MKLEKQRGKLVVSLNQDDLDKLGGFDDLSWMSTDQLTLKRTEIDKLLAKRGQPVKPVIKKTGPDIRFNKSTLRYRLESSVRENKVGGEVLEFAMPLGPFNITCVVTIPGEGEDEAPVWVEFRTKDTPPTKRDAEWQKKLSKPLKAKGKVAELIRFIKRLDPNDELQFNVIQDAWNKMIVANLQQTSEE